MALFLSASIYLALRSLVLLLRFKCSFFYKLGLLFHLLFFCVSSTLLTVRSEAFSSFKSHPVVLSLLIFCFCLEVISLYKRPRYPPWIIMGLIQLGFICVVSLVVIQTNYKDVPIAKIQLSGQCKKERVLWQNPMQPMQEKSLNMYHVTLYSPSGNEIAQDFFFGELVGLKIHSLQLHPVLHFLGWSHLYKIDALCSDYLSDDMMSMPRKVLPISPYSNVPKWLSSAAWKLWEIVFFKQLHLAVVRKASVEMKYIPLTDTSGKAIEGVFDLVQTADGITYLQPKYL